jgi:hypothetical protein
MERLTMDIRGLAPNVEALDVRIAEQKELLRLKVNGNAVALKIALKTQERDELVKEVQAINFATARMKDDMANAVVEVREKSIGLMLPEVQLAYRQPLKNAQIQSITAEGVRFKHAGGVMVAPTSDLPADLQDRFRFDLVPLDRTIVVSTAPSAAPKNEMQIKDAEAAKHEEKVKKLQTLVTQYTHEQEDLKARWEKIVDATRENNNMSNRYKAEEARKQLYAQYVAAQDRLRVTERELQRLRENPPQ